MQYGRKHIFNIKLYYVEKEMKLCNKKKQIKTQTYTNVRTWIKVFTHRAYLVGFSETSSTFCSVSV